jgi:hypothetical protein
MFQLLYDCLASCYNLTQLIFMSLIHTFCKVVRHKFVRMSLTCSFTHFVYFLGEQGLPLPVYMPAVHPVPLRRSAVCLFSGKESVGSGASVPEAKNSAAKAMWLLQGHIITIDQRYFIFVIIKCDHNLISTSLHMPES